MHNCHQLLVVRGCLSIPLAFVLLLCSSLLGADESPIPVPQTGTSYISPNFPSSQWQFVSGKKDAVISDTWFVSEDLETKTPILICKGEPHGYLRTTEVFANFDMQLEWRYPTDRDGNSGVLLFLSGEDRVWPASLQVQLHQPELGSTFPIGGAKSTNELRVGDKLAKPLNQWNHCEIRCRLGVVTVSINGHEIGDVTGFSCAAGPVGLQSEGSEIHFRGISIREIPSDDLELTPLNSKAAQQTTLEKK